MKLYIVGTPIGNLSDMSPRGLQTLSSVDFIAAEDTRVTQKLLRHFEIETPMISYHEHNKYEKGELIVSRILSGQSCALVTDAGMPAISDPGEELVKQCCAAGITIETVPGPTALTTALAVSGLPTGRFTFEGFLTVNKRNRREHLAELKKEKRTMIFYEAPHKLTTTLKDLYTAFGDREISIIKELTKIHETVIRTSLCAAQSLFEEVSPRGEFVLVLKGYEECPEIIECTFEQSRRMALKLVSEGISKSTAAKQIAKQTDFSKDEIYKSL